MSTREKEKLSSPSLVGSCLPPALLPFPPHCTFLVLLSSECRHRKDKEQHLPLNFLAFRLLLFFLKSEFDQKINREVKEAIKEE